MQGSVLFNRFELPHRLQASDLRHVHVHQHEMDVGSIDDLDCLPPMGGLGNAKAPALRRPNITSSEMPNRRR